MKLSIAIISLTAVAFVYWYSNSTPDPIESRTSVTETRRFPSTDSIHMQGEAPQSGNSGILSPFGKGAAPDLNYIARLDQRSKRMESGHYTTPVAYFDMSLTELRARADQNDVFARLQLAEQYWHESSEISRDPSFERGANSSESAIKYMSAAAAQGHSRAASMVSSMYETQGQIVEAYSWALVSKQLFDSTASELLTRYDNRISPVQKQAAEALAAQELARATHTIGSALQPSQSR